MCRPFFLDESTDKKTDFHIGCYPQQSTEFCLLLVFNPMENRRINAIVDELRRVSETRPYHAKYDMVFALVKITCSALFIAGRTRTWFAIPVKPARIGS